MSSINGSLKTKGKIVGLIKLGAPSDPYEGNYDVIPSVVEQKLLTANKSMSKDVTVYPIPYVEEPNVSGGITVKIG